MSQEQKNELKGEPGTNGVKGEDGISPTVKIENIDNGKKVIITDKTGEKSFDVLNGTKGEPGTNGLKGDDGVSPSVRIIEESNGHRVTFTDKTGEKSIFIKNGEAGEPGKFDVHSLSEEDRKIFKTELVNDLTTGGVDKALSAEQGKVLFQSVDKGKDLIAKALVDKNVQASKDESFGDLASKIKEIKGNAPGGGYGVGDIIEAQKIEPISKDNYKYKFAFKYKYDRHFLDGQGNYYVIYVTHTGKHSDSLTRYTLIKYDKDGYTVWDNKDFTYYFIDGEDNIYIGNEFGLIKYDKNNNKVWKDSTSCINLKRVSSDNEGNFYVNKDYKLTKYNKENVKLWKIESVDKYVHDDEGNVYTANDRSIIKYNKDGVEVWTREFHCDSDLRVDKSGYLYFIVKDGKEYQLMSLDENGDTLLTSEKSNKEISFDFNVTNKAIVKISSKVIVYANYGTEEWKVEGRDFKCDNQGNIYVQPAKGELIKYDENGKILHKYSDKKIKDYAFDEKGNLYLSMRDSLIKYDTDNTKQWEISGDRYYCLDKEGDVYFVREGVVYKYSKGEEESLYDLKKMNYDTHSTSLVMLDNFGNLYIGSAGYSYKLAKINEKIITGYKIRA